MYENVLLIVGFIKCLWQSSTVLILMHLTGDEQRKIGTKIERAYLP